MRKNNSNAAPSPEKGSFVSFSHTALFSSSYPPHLNLISHLESRFAYHCGQNVQTIDIWPPHTSQSPSSTHFRSNRTTPPLHQDLPYHHSTTHFYTIDNLNAALLFEAIFCCQIESLSATHPSTMVVTASTPIHATISTTILVIRGQFQRKKKGNKIHQSFLRSLHSLDIKAQFK